MWLLLAEVPKDIKDERITEENQTLHKELGMRRTIFDAQSIRPNRTVFTEEFRLPHRDLWTAKRAFLGPSNGT